MSAAITRLDAQDVHRICAGQVVNILNISFSHYQY